MQWLRIKRDILAAKAPPHKSMGSQPHAGIPNTEQHRQKEEHAQHLVLKISGDSACVGKKGVCYRCRHNLPRVITLIVIALVWVGYCLVIELSVTSHCCGQVLHRGPLHPAGTCEALFFFFFLEKLLEETLTVIM